MFVDGEYVDSQVCRNQHTTNVAGAPLPGGLQRRFVFHDLNVSGECLLAPHIVLVHGLYFTGDSDTLRKDWSDWERFGMVEVVAFRVERSSAHPRIDPSHALGGVLNRVGTVHTGSTKAGMHHTRYVQCSMVISFNMLTRGPASEKHCLNPRRGTLYLTSTVSPTLSPSCVFFTDRKVCKTLFLAYTPF